MQGSSPGYTFHRASSSPPSNSPPTSSSPLSSLPSSSPPPLSAASDSDDEDAKVPKPIGEAYRPGRGGYTPQDVLGWDTKHFKELQVCSKVSVLLLFLNATTQKNVNDACTDLLRVRYCYSKQSKPAIDAAVQRVSPLLFFGLISTQSHVQVFDQHQNLIVYENLWPIHDLIKARLKYKSSRSRN